MRKIKGLIMRVFQKISIFLLLIYSLNSNGHKKENVPLKKTLRFLFIGDIVGDSGLELMRHWLPKIKEKYQIDAIVVNGENAAKSGLGITADNVDFLQKQGVMAITTGNHVWENKDLYNSLNNPDILLRPANYSHYCPGKGCSIYEVKGIPVAIINLMGRTFFNEPLDCPFHTAHHLIKSLDNVSICLVDFHAEASYEKSALGFFLDGKVSAVIGTHTHIQTADEQILPQGTGFITDVGCCSSLDSVVGFCKKDSIVKFLSHNKMGGFSVEKKGPWVFSGACIEVDVASGKTVHIERIRIIDPILPEVYNDSFKS
jgi:2',3'-cyclic-nucleotide 2'-phosphodiesterase